MRNHFSATAGTMLQMLSLTVFAHKIVKEFEQHIFRATF